MLMLLSLFGVVVIVIYLHKKLTYWDRHGVINKKPAFPYVIPVHLFNRFNYHLDLAASYNKYKGQGPALGILFFLKPFLIAIDLEFIKNMFINNFDSFHDRFLYNNEKDDPLSSNLLTMEGEKWRDMRTWLSPSFSALKLKQMFPLGLKVSEQLNATLSEQLETSPIVDIKALSARFTTDVIGSCAFGLDCNSLKYPNAKFYELGKKTATEYFVLFKIFFLEPFRSWARRFRIKVFPKQVSDFFIGVIKETVDYRQKNGIERLDLINILMQMGIKQGDNANEDGKFTLNEIAGSAFIYFFAGFETSALTINYTMFELSQNQALQDKVRSSINTVLAKHKGEITYESVGDMAFLEQCVNETLRKYPAGPLISRKVTKDYQMPGTKAIIKKGTCVFIPVYAIHHDAELYPNPEVYDPERFSDEEVKKRPAMAYIPFGAGPRICAGYRFAALQIKLALIILLSKYRVSLAPTTDTQLQFANATLALTTTNKMHLIFEKI